MTSKALNTRTHARTQHRKCEMGHKGNIPALAARKTLNDREANMIDYEEQTVENAISSLSPQRNRKSTQRQTRCRVQFLHDTWCVCEKQEKKKLKKKKVKGTVQRQKNKKKNEN